MTCENTSRIGAWISFFGDRLAPRSIGENPRPFAVPPVGQHYPKVGKAQAATVAEGRLGLGSALAVAWGADDAGAVAGLEDAGEDLGGAGGVGADAQGQGGVDGLCVGGAVLHPASVAVDGGAPDATQEPDALAAHVRICAGGLIL